MSTNTTQTPSQESITVCALYKFTAFPEFEQWREKILANFEENGIKGTLLIAHEGINGTIAGSQAGIDATIEFLQSIPAVGDISYKLSYTDSMPFYRTKVKLKKEIVTMGVTDIDPRTDAGEYVTPEQWNDLISDPEVVLIDTRNDYEYQVGTFKNAVNPNTDTFREFPKYVEENLDKDKHKKVAMFCTGGIRCEKSTAYLKQQGFENVYHLQGGILQYFEDVKTEESLWDGECFVFDNRVTVNQELEAGKYDQCYACRMPITEEEKQLDSYIVGQSCLHCVGKTSLAQKQRFKDREKQLQLAKERGEKHIGGDVSDEIAKRREEKARIKQENIAKSQQQSKK